MPKPQQIQDLTALAFEIDLAHMERDTYRCGMLLIQAKRLLVHGEWIDWLKTNCKIPERTVREYMKLARSPKEYKGTKLSSHKTAPKKANLSPGKIVRVIGENAPNFGQSVEVIEVEGLIVKCKTHDNEIAVYSISDLIPSKEKRPNKSKPESKQEQNLVESLSSALEIEKLRIELLESLLKQFISAAYEKQRPAQDLLKEAESILS